MNRKELQHALSTLSTRERSELAKLILQGLTPDDLESCVDWPELFMQREVAYRAKPVVSDGKPTDNITRGTSRMHVRTR
ncbi:MAG: hypothetical protein LAT52_11180 [Balneolales bacterium]|nr:hypothetical protein [Balneolales bacterium]